MSKLDKYGKRIGQTDRWRRPIGLLEIVTIVLIILKVTNLVDWSWWLILAPWWIPMAIVTSAFFGLLTYLIIMFFIGDN